MFIQIAGTTALPITDPDHSMLRSKRGIARAQPHRQLPFQDVLLCLCQADKVSMWSSKQSTKFSEMIFDMTTQLYGTPGVVDLPEPYRKADEHHVGSQKYGALAKPFRRLPVRSMFDTHPCCILRYVDVSPLSQGLPSCDDSAINDPVPYATPEPRSCYCPHLQRLSICPPL